VRFVLLGKPPHLVLAHVERAVVLLGQLYVSGGKTDLARYAAIFSGGRRPSTSWEAGITRVTSPLTVVAFATPA
jgi:hypothetical protein